MVNGPDILDTMQKSVITLWDWLALEDQPEECNLIFLFGGSIIEIAEKGRELYERGLSSHIIATGNKGTFGNPDWKKPIAKMFADYLIDHDIPKAALTTQSTSMNTLEDVTQGLSLLDQQGIRHDSVILVSRPVHQRRAYATYKMHDPNARIMNAPCNETHPSQMDNTALKEVALRCVQEYERLTQYAAKGDLCEQQVPPNVRAEYEELKSRISTDI